MTIHKIAVIGAGVMGTGIAIDFASYGYDVILKDISRDILDKAKEKIAEDLPALGFRKERLRDLSLDDLLEHITFTTSYDGFKDVDLVVENVTEQFDVKKIVFGELANECREDAIIAVNTSCLSITRMGSLVPNPARVIGTHFMNPVPLKKLVETIRGHHTSEETIASISEFLGKVEKTPVVVNDYPGFVTNRVMMLMINEAAYVVQDGVASPKDVDKIFRLGFAHSMGPLATADLIGLDTILYSVEVLHESYSDSKYRPCPLLRKMVAAGLLGRKSGKGFFKYPKAEL